MNKPTLKLIALSVSLLALPAVVRSQYTYGDFTYDFGSGTVWITGYTGPGGQVNIPSSIYVAAVTNSLPVTSIGNQAFAGNANITSVTIPNSFTAIPGWAFHLCTSLTSITIPDSVTNIGFSSFSLCTSLTNVVFGNGLTSIGYGAFEDCQSLTSISIPDNVTSVGYEAFYQCYHLKFVSIGNGVTSIEEQTFRFCTNLTSIKMGNSVTSVGDKAFWGCSSLPSITMPKSVSSIGNDLFANCSGLTAVYFMGNAPSVNWSSFQFSYPTVYYLLGTTGWEDFARITGLLTVLWNPQVQTDGASFGVRTNQFGFNITGPSGADIVVEACTNLFHPDWQPVQTNALTTGSAYFNDSQWTNYPGRFYRLRSP